MIKETIEFVASYPTWVKAAVVGLAAIGALLLVLFRPQPQPKPTKARAFRIDRIESQKPFEFIALLVAINGSEQRFPTGYDFVKYEPNMGGGEYQLNCETECIVGISATVKLKEERRVIPNRPPKVVDLTLEFKARQPIRLAASTLPAKGIETLRVVQYGVQAAPREYDLQLHYSAQ